MQEGTSSDFVLSSDDLYLHSTNTTLVYFYIPSCVYCPMAERLVRAINIRGISKLKVNLGNNIELAPLSKKFPLKAVPRIFLYIGGMPVAHIPHNIPLEDVVKNIHVAIEEYAKRANLGDIQPVQGMQNNVSNTGFIPYNAVGNQECYLKL